MERVQLYRIMSAWSSINEDRALVVKLISSQLCKHDFVSSIYKFGLSVCLSVCLFVSNKRQNGWTDRAHIFCGTSHDPREGLWMIKFSKICLHQNSIFENFENPQIFFLKIRKIFCFYYLLTRRSPVFFIFTNEIKYRRKAP